MTRQRSFKHLVRSRMAKTGESYTTARAMLLGETSSPSTTSVLTPLPATDEKIRTRTGRGWEEWFDLLDQSGAADRSHRENARWLAAEQGVKPLAWNVQIVVDGYEKARLGKLPGEKEDGFTVNVSRTAPVPVETLYDAVLAASSAEGWLPSGAVSMRTATRPKSARFDAPGASRIALTFGAKGPAKSTVSLAHSRLADAAAADELKAWWRKRLDALVGSLGGGAADA